MKRLLLILLPLMLLFTSCSNTTIGFTDLFYLDYDFLIKQATANSVFESIKSRDPAEIKSLFAPRAIEEADDLNDQIATMLDYIQGDLLSYSAEDNVSVCSAKNEGLLTESIDFSFVIKTQTGEYGINVYRKITDEMDRKNEEIVLISLIDIQDWDREIRFYANGFMPEHYGIHVVDRSYAKAICNYFNDQDPWKEDFSYEDWADREGV
ncbi:MAG: DUF5104 domain-containing protein [Clostridia bacterium]|nr:DUF5104 domain-containing protein [Clostridia bacterium]